MSAAASACRFLVLASVCFGLLVAEAGAATRYVAPGGAGSTCTQAAPCGTLDRAYKTALPGDAVQVGAGSYGSQLVDKDATKTVGSAPVVFQAQGATFSGFTTRANDVQYVGLNVPNNDVVVRAGQNVVVSKARAHKPYIWGPRPGVDPGDRINNVTIRDSEFGPHTSCGGGFQITADGPPRNVKIIGNYFHDFHIDASCPTAHLDCMHTFNGIDGLTIVGNRFVHCEHFGILVNGASNVVVENNFLEGGIYGFKLRGDSDPSIEKFNNVVIRNNSGDEMSLGSSGSNTLTNVRVEANATVERIDCRNGVTYNSNLAQHGSPCGSGDLANVASIGFANTSIGDFHVPLSSPAVDRMTTGPIADYDGDTRAQGTKYDIGADEVVQSGSPPPPAACADGADNDGDGLIDTADPGCTGTSDNDETNAPPPPPPPPPAACADGADNDGDGLIDTADPGCTGTSDNDETNALPVPPPPTPPMLPACSDGVDNDGDGLIDLADGGCTSLLDTDETGPALGRLRGGGNGKGKGKGGLTAPATTSTRVALSDVTTSVRVTRRDTVKLRLVCLPGTGSTAAKRCTGSVALLAVARGATASRSQRAQVLGRARFSIRAGHRKVVRLRLSRRARAGESGRSARRVKVHVTMRRTGTAGLTTGKPVKLVWAARRQL